MGNPEQMMQIQGEMLKDFAKGMLIIKQALESDKTTNDKIKIEVDKALAYLTTGQYYRKNLDVNMPTFFQNAADITADASLRTNYYLKKIRDLIINRMDCPTRNTPKCQHLICRLMIYYWAIYNDGYVEHRRNIIIIRNTMFSGFLNMNSAGVDAFTNTLDPAFYEEMKRMQDSKKDTGQKVKNWKETSIGSKKGDSVKA
jgi:hypothetical protein